MDYPDNCHITIGSEYFSINLLQDTCFSGILKTKAQGHFIRPHNERNGTQSADVMIKKQNDTIIFTADKSRVLYLALIIITVVLIYCYWRSPVLRMLAVTYGFFTLFKFQRVVISNDFITMAYLFGLIKFQRKIDFKDITKISHGKYVKNYYALKIYTSSSLAILYGAAFSTTTFASIVESILSRLSRECTLGYPFYFMRENNTAQRFYIFRKRREIRVISAAIILWGIMIGIIRILYIRG
ncbi:MAG: hypothetical protein Q8O30_13045 [Candidatus Omnitrophota bacterium]|nr:hypothetical protein [Candidatus Omnitrophota bacterium]